jgi:hypothetical protein
MLQCEAMQSWAQKEGGPMHCNKPICLGTTRNSKLCNQLSDVSALLFTRITNPENDTSPAVAFLQVLIRSPAMHQ